jgi:hypothetical protein
MDDLFPILPIDQYDIHQSIRERRRATAENLLENYSAINREKINLRESLLQENPELKIRIDLEKLKSIIDFHDFKCSPNCSIASDRAIKGSDIDGGLVISIEKSNIEEEMLFIQELRSQGFDIYHLAEYLKAKKKYESLPDSEKLSEIGDILRKDYHAKDHYIQFVSYKTAEKVANSDKLPNNSDWIYMYLAGSSISEVYKNLQG